MRVAGKTDHSVLHWNANRKLETYRPILWEQTKIDHFLLLGKLSSVTYEDREKRLNNL